MSSQVYSLQLLHQRTTKKGNILLTFPPTLSSSFMCVSLHILPQIIVLLFSFLFYLPPFLSSLRPPSPSFSTSPHIISLHSLIPPLLILLSSLPSPLSPFLSSSLSPSLFPSPSLHPSSPPSLPLSQGKRYSKRLPWRSSVHDERILGRKNDMCKDSGRKGEGCCHRNTKRAMESETFPVSWEDGVHRE